jgi:hypothetical protein
MIIIGLMSGTSLDGLDNGGKNRQYRRGGLLSNFQLKVYKVLKYKVYKVKR